MRIVKYDGGCISIKIIFCVKILNEKAHVYKIKCDKKNKVFILTTGKCCWKKQFPIYRENHIKQYEKKSQQIENIQRFCLRLQRVSK